MFQWDVRALEILDALEQAGHQAVLVGGCVRDALLGREPHDYDAAVSAPPEEILAACRSKFKCIPTGLAHGTVTVVHGGLPVEVTTFRKEGTYSDHRHPDRVEYTSRLEEDLARRDESCVIVGRCADYILRDFDNVLSIYVHAPKDYCIRTTMEIRNLSEEEAWKFIQKTDKRRSDYYRYFTGNDWKDADNYDLCLNSAKLGWDKCMDLIEAYLKIKLS